MAGFCRGLSRQWVWLCVNLKKSVFLKNSTLVLWTEWNWGKKNGSGQSKTQSYFLSWLLAELKISPGRIPSVSREIFYIYPK